MFPVRALDYRLFSCFKVCVLAFQASGLLQYRKCPESRVYGVWLHIPCQNEFTKSSHWGALVVKKQPANAGAAMWVQFPAGEDPLEKVMATGSSILAWRISWTEELGGLWSMLRRVNALELLNEHIFSLGS